MTAGTLIAAGTRVRDQRVVFLGSGSAGCGIAEKIVALMMDDGLTEAEARSRVFMVDRFGLLTDDMTNLLDFQKNLLTAREAIRDWQVESNNISLMDVVKNAHPTVMIGVSGQPGLFSEEIVKEMHRHCPRPVIMPLSNRRNSLPGHRAPRSSPPAARLRRCSGRASSTILPSVITPMYSPGWGWVFWPAMHAGSPRRC